MELPKRTSPRLHEYDYSTPGAYFITICTHEKCCILSSIVPVGEELAPPEALPSQIGRIIVEQVCLLPERFPSVSVDAFTVMPNHIHLLLTLSNVSGGASSSPTVIAVIQALKSLSARAVSQRFGIKPLWQRSFYDHVIRDQADYDRIYQYIENNPARWAEDRFYVPDGV